MNAVFPEFLRALSQAEIPDLLTGDWWLQPLAAGTPYDASAVDAAFYSGNFVGAGIALAIDSIDVTATAVQYATSGTYTLSDVGLGDDVGALLIWTYDGVDTWLAAWLDVRSDTSPVAFVATGGDVEVTFPSGWFIQL